MKHASSCDIEYQTIRPIGCHLTSWIRYCMTSFTGLTSLIELQLVWIVLNVILNANSFPPRTSITPSNSRLSHLRFVFFGLDLSAHYKLVLYLYLYLYRVFFKLAVTVHRCLNGRIPLYLSDNCVPVAGADTRRHLLSINCQLLAVPRHQLNTYGSTVWNSLPWDLTITADCLRRFLKADMQWLFTKLTKKYFLAAYCNVNPSV